MVSFCHFAKCRVSLDKICAVSSAKNSFSGVKTLPKATVHWVNNLAPFVVFENFILFSQSRALFFPTASEYLTDTTKIELFVFMSYVA